MDNRNKTDKVDESILEETPPNINEPQNNQDNPENQDPNPEPETPPADETTPEDETPETTDETTPQTTEEEVPADATTPEEPVTPIAEPQEETEEQKRQRYNAQQSEAQVQKARSDAIITKVEQANNLPDPTQEQLIAFVAQDGANWDDLTPFEQAQAKRLWKSEQRDKLLSEAVTTTKDIDAFATKVDEFIDATDGKPEFVKLSGHEAEFRRYAMQESHRGTPIDVLLNAFLYTLPTPTKQRASLFQKGGGGEANPKPGVITEVDELTALRTTNPREYKRRIKAGKVELDV